VIESAVDGNPPIRALVSRHGKAAKQARKGCGYAGDRTRARILRLASFWPSWIAASLLVSFPVAAWRHDNQVGACFPLALILVFVILILVVLIAMLGMLWAAHQ
jgi:hypothetical protein